jgi:hypothetical protein
VSLGVAARETDFSFPTKRYYSKTISMDLRKVLCTLFECDDLNEIYEEFIEVGLGRLES